MRVSTMAPRVTTRDIDYTEYNSDLYSSKQDESDSTARYYENDSRKFTAAISIISGLMLLFFLGVLFTCIYLGFNMEKVCQ